jgi:hypothetical protein
MSDAISKAIEAMELALEYMDSCHAAHGDVCDAIEALQALQSGEPVAWLCDAGDGENINATCSLTALADYKRFGRKITPLYTPPQPATTKPIAAVRGWFHGECVIHPLDPSLALPAGMALYGAPQLVNQQLVEALKACEECLTFIHGGEPLRTDVPLKLAREALLSAGKETDK